MARQLEGTARATPVWVALVSLLVTAIIWVSAVSFLRERDAMRFRNNVRNAQNRIEDRMIRQINLLRATRAMVIVGSDMDRKRFKLFADSLNFEDNYPGLQGLGLSLKIRPEQLAYIEGRMRTREGVPNFTVHPKGSESHAIVMIEPRSPSNNKVLGFNMFSESTRREAMERARDTGQEALTAKVRLKQENAGSEEPGFLLYYPFYGTRVTPETEAERRKHLEGFAYSPFRARDIFGAIFRDNPEPFVRITVYDGEGEQEENLLYRTTPPPGFVPQYTDSAKVLLGGHYWTVHYENTPAFAAASGTGLLWWIPLIGLLVTVILFGLSYRQAKTAQSLALHATELERSEFRQRLLADAGTLLNMSLNYEETLAAVARLAVPSFADWTSVDVLDTQGVIRRIAVAHVKPEKVKWAQELQERFPPDPDSPTGVPNVLRTGQSELHEYVPQELLRAAAKTEEMWEIIQEIGFSSVMVVPMRSRGKTMGALTFVWAESGKHYDREDLQLAQEIADRAAVSMDNALLYSQAQNERAEVARLNENLESLVQERTHELETAVNELEAFSYSVSHDLRSPLRSVDGFSRALLDDYGDVLDDSGKEYLHKIRAAAKRMDELISALLGLSRITRTEIVRKPLDLSKIAEAAASEAVAARGAHVKVEVQPGMTGTGDPRLVPILLDNLLSNAVKFSAKGSDPLIEVGQQGTTFFVRDNGVGFNPEYAAKLFAPFERLHSVQEYPGSGIGLATVQRIVQRHGGHIWAESQEGKGATFFFTLGDR